MRILLVDDDEVLIDLLTRTLEQQNYAIDVAKDGEQGWIYGSTYPYDLMILDWSLPKLDGITLCQRFRNSGLDNPIILLTSRDGSQNKIRGLDSGADDYICKPFDIEELAARIRALLRRMNCDFFPVLSWGNLQLNPSNCTVTYQEKPISLGAKEYRLLELFLRHSQEVLSIEEIIDRLWSSTEYPADATVRSHMRRLRQKLKRAGLPRDFITTIRGQGYCLKPFMNNSEVIDNSLINYPQESIELEPTTDKRAQHIAALTSIWEKYQPKREKQLKILSQAVESLQVGNLETCDRVSAIVVAHSLAGNLGQFGLDRASQLAKELEKLLQKDLNYTEILQLHAKLQSLRQELSKQQDITSQLTEKLSENSPFLLIINYNELLTEDLVTEAQNQGISTKIIATSKLVKIWLDEIQAKNQKFPDAVVIKISFAEDSSTQDSLSEKLDLIAEFKLLTPSIPVIVVADRDLFQDRLQVSRHGGKFYITQPISAGQIISVCQQALKYSSVGKKIMIVDDDIELLKILPTLLKPWGFKLTTLDDPRQFWDVLQAITPDLLVLDIEMPYLSGIELCKVLRTHTYWCRLPVLFLSVHTDKNISNQVFASGANDFVNKPVIPQQLAHRILNRLRSSKNLRK
ncbi:MAG: response regulator [Cyanobacteria bacterium P01_F01_bin.143]